MMVGSRLMSVGITMGIDMNHRGQRTFNEPLRTASTAWKTAVGPRPSSETFGRPDTLGAGVSVTRVLAMMWS